MVNENFPTAARQELFAGLKRPELPHRQYGTPRIFA
jgi:hypothetical protein